MRVCKFGGSSLADASRVRAVEQIIRMDGSRRCIVVSAPGKRTSRDQKVTDLLYLCHELAAAGVSFGEPFGIIRDRFVGMARELENGIDMGRLMDQTAAQIAEGASTAFVASRGEFLTAKLIASFLGADFVDAATCIRLTEDGKVGEESYRLLSNRLKGNGLFVIPGFYGADEQGRIQTFSRGGSDVTGAIVARAVDAEVYENWTDVSGFLMTNPTIVENPRPMREITYKEIRELAYMGAQVFHEEAILPVYQQGIPINIRNTQKPNDEGTMIVAKRSPGKDVVAGIAGRKGFTQFRVDKLLLNTEIGFGRRLLEVFESHGVSFEHAPTGIDSMGVIVRDENLGTKTALIVRDIERALEPDRVEVEGGLALIATVGEAMNHRAGVAARLFGALADAEINIRIIDQGSSEINIIVGVDESDYEKAVRAIYAAFN